MMIKKRTLLSAVFLAAFIAGGGGIQSLLAQEDDDEGVEIDEIICAAGQIPVFGGVNWTCGVDQVGAGGLGLVVTDSTLDDFDNPASLTVGTVIGANNFEVTVALDVDVDPTAAVSLETIAIRVSRTTLLGNAGPVIFNSLDCSGQAFGSFLAPEPIWPAVAVITNSTVLVEDPTATPLDPTDPTDFPAVHPSPNMDVPLQSSRDETTGDCFTFALSGFGGPVIALDAADTVLTFTPPFSVSGP